MEKDSIRFWIIMLILAAMLVVIDIAVGVFADNAMDKLPNFSGDLAKDNYRLHRMDADVVILGSSRGCYHYVSQQLNDSTDAYLGKHFSLYNAAISNKFANSNSCAAEAIIARYHPKLVIYDISEDQLCENKVKDIEFSSPFYWKDTIVRRYLDEIGPRERLLMKSNLYRYNCKLLRIVFSLFSPEAPNDGYKPLRGTAEDLTEFDKEGETSKPASELDSYTLNNFENVLKKYSSAKVPLVIVSSPKYRPNDNNKRLAAICEKYDIPFIDFYDTPYFNDHPELFYDAKHLNDKGAHVYTAMFFKQLKQYL